MANDKFDDNFFLIFIFVLGDSLVYICSLLFLSHVHDTSIPRCRWWISTFSPLLLEEFVCKKFMRTFSLSICLRREYTVLCKHQFWCFFAVFLGKVNIFSRGTMWNIDKNTFNECETRPVAEQKKNGKIFCRLEFMLLFAMSCGFARNSVEFAEGGQPHFKKLKTVSMQTFICPREEREKN